MSSKKPDKKSRKVGSLLLGREREKKHSVSTLNDGHKTRLLELFSLIEQEFDQLHSENAALRERIDKLEALHNERHSSVDIESLPVLSTEAPLPVATQPLNTPLRKIRISGEKITRKLRTYTPSKKSRSNVTECSQVCEYVGHRDGVWQVSHSRHGKPLIATASADGTACVWDPDSTHMLLRYTGHTGSVNSVTFHPRELLVASGSGDNTIHVWNTSLPSHRLMEKNHSFDSSGDERTDEEEPSPEQLTQQSSPTTNVKLPFISLTGHKAPVMSCDWMLDGQKLVSGSWDRTAKLWDFESAQVIHSLEGHDQELTHVCAHPTQQLLVTSSEDATFRLWDFRAPPIHSVNVFQGHSKAVNSAAFSSREYVVSGSDDHFIKIWDLRNMRAPVESVRLECGVNRISVNHDDKAVLAVPLDNGLIKLYDLTGARLASLPRRNRHGHRRMVYSVAWSCDSHGTSERCNLFSSGFDNKVVGWKIIS